MMIPYFEDDHITLYCGDSKEILPSLSNIDLLITDPPYGQNYQSNMRSLKFDKITGDQLLDQDYILNIILDSVKLLRRGRHCYVFGEFDLSEFPLGGLSRLIWDKEIMVAGDLSLPWGKSYESLWFGVHENSKANRDKGYGNGAARLRRESVLRFQREQSKQIKYHPTQKPIYLLRELVESSSRIGETVLDPFAGGGSTLIAAKLEERRAIGIEIEEKYCETIVKRIKGES